MLITVSSPSGGGKKTLIQAVRNNNPEIRLSVSYTTRSKKEGEVDGLDYRYIDNRMFSDMALGGKFVEHAEVHGHFYGTLEAEISPAIDDRCDMIAEVDYNGVLQIRRKAPDVKAIFILPSSFNVLEERLRGRRRERDSREITERLATALVEMNKVSLFNFWIVNDDLEGAIEEFTELIRLIRSRTVVSVDRFRNPSVLGQVQATFPACV